MILKIPRAIKVMPDYDCHALWNQDPRSDWDYNLDPRLLPVPDALKARLENWAERFDDTLDRDDPRASGFASEHDEARFVEEGRELMLALKEALPAVSWSYFDVRTGRAEAALSRND